MSVLAKIDREIAKVMFLFISVFDLNVFKTIFFYLFNQHFNLYELPDQRRPQISKRY